MERKKDTPWLDPEQEARDEQSRALMQRLYAKFTDSGTIVPNKVSHLVTVS